MKRNTTMSKKPEIVIDQSSGFCIGVRKAIERAELSLETGTRTYCLGKIVHNPAELKRLDEEGLNFIGHEEFSKLKNETVLIRAHGEPPETFNIAKKNNLTLVDATCPIVARLQARIRLAAEQAQKNGGQVLIYGKKDHPEVRALVGQSRNMARVVTGAMDMEDIDFSKPVALFAQTTMDPDEFNGVIDKMQRLIQQEGKDPGQNLVVNDTICRHVSHRKPEILKFAGTYDMILFAAGRESSNGKLLFESCCTVNPRSFFISSINDLAGIDMSGAGSIGICGATSTPLWFLKEVEQAVKQKFDIMNE
jgi:4-hydroxy-3-methylbut-2-enyl diphosphate reductase